MSEQIAVIVRDTVLYDPISDEELMTLFFPKRTITARELIEERVRQEVQTYNDRLPEVFRGLVAPLDAEKVLNGFRMPRKRSVDAGEQCRLACEAFENNGFILLVEERQVETLDEPIEIRTNTSVAFLKLTPLVGG
ncbi:MAG TPA: hypothetical protein VHO48_15160 [Anaerolineaceae bacterium]|nr:hypothetical protein [Anaerolineaceae bacterium]